MIESAELKEVEKRVRRAVLRLVGNNADVDDIIQQMYLKLLVARGNAISNLPGLMMTIARNLAKDLGRHRDVLDFATETDLEELVGDADIERTWMAWDEIQRISQFANTLTPRQREAFVLMQIMGHSQCEVARMLNPPTTARGVESLMNVAGRKGWRQLVTEYEASD